jgi:riboflavin synthase
MFTGIVQGRGRVQQIEESAGVRSLWVALPGDRAAGLEVGASVSIAGVCLTAVEVQPPVVRFDCIDETLRRTTLGRLQLGGEVNVERAARVGDEVGGHFLSGHVYETAVVTSRVETGGNLALTLHITPDGLRWVMPKGYIAVDGTSLTVGEVAPDESTFTVHLIPETRRATTLERLRRHDLVNIEFDALTQAVVETTERILGQRR